MGAQSAETGGRSVVGDSLARVLPNDGIPWYKKRHLLLLNLYTGTLALLSAALGYDGTMMNGLQALSQWSDFMDSPTGSWLGFINAIQSLSSAVTYPLVAYCANRWGRKKGLYVGYFFLFLGVFLQAFAPNSAAFIVGRFFLGQPSAWWAGLAPLLITELAYPTHRSILTCLFMCGWYVGSTVAAWAIYGTRDYTTNWAWRVPSLLQIAIPIIALPVLFFIDESPRYLIAKGQTAKARAILVKLHAGGDESSPLVAYEMLEIERAIEADTSAKNSTSWMDLVNSPGNRHRAFISVSLGVFAQWNGVGVVSYYLAKVLKSVGITSVTNQTLISGCLQIWNLIWSIGGAACVDRAGRRPLFICGSFGMLISYIIISALSGTFANTGNHAAGIAVVPFLYIYYAFYDISFTPLVIAYTAEIWPYHLRARGTALMHLSTYAAIFFNTFVNPIALEDIGWKYYVVFACILVVVVLTMYFFYPETKGHSLEEIAVVFDGESAAVTDPGDVNMLEKTDVSHLEEKSDQ